MKASVRIKAGLTPLRDHPDRLDTRFSIYHAAELDDPVEPFPIQYESL